LETSSDPPEVILEGMPLADARLSPSGHIPLRSIDAVAVHIPSIETARLKVTTEMESMVLEGLAQVASYFPRLEKRAPVNLLCSIEPAVTCDFTPDCA
jgi:hypothetical protein